LILADGLHHAAQLEPDYIVDLATLTGACVVALGHDASGLYSNDERLTALLRKAGDESGDRVWPMPLFPEYQEDVKSEVADLKNSTGRDGGAGTAAFFLSRFVGERKWAHLDIAGTAYGGRKRDYLDKGVAGAGVRLLCAFLEALA
ncbi:MAG: leucyl aminopeptidase, partial [Planctomycetes bacterium]|nr:leucyl aminopeptidase [Planctomycetota bacterium]